ncbi:MAG: hypothetical protein HY727_04520 [Candidatus Rokubacteria bacterium]|nr:hypothetical protein [Candidatus Rokubacteria bacterium]
MSPGGHLVTTAAACAAAAALSDSLPLAAGIAAGGFLIDVDHAVDYVLFDRQRDLRPSAFLRHYLEGRLTYAVLLLHSWELMALLVLTAWWTEAPAVWGYVAGALGHLLLDITFNAEMTPRSIVAFYSFAYRAAHGFRAAVLLGPVDVGAVPRAFWRAFFLRRERPGSPALAADAPPPHA